MIRLGLAIRTMIRARSNKSQLLKPITHDKKTRQFPLSQYRKVRDEQHDFTDTTKLVNLIALRLLRTPDPGKCRLDNQPYTARGNLKLPITLRAMYYRKQSCRNTARPGTPDKKLVNEKTMKLMMKQCSAPQRIEKNSV